MGVIRGIPVDWSVARSPALRVDNLFDKRHFSSAQVKIRNLDTTGANRVEDFCGLSGEPAAVFGSIGLYSEGGDHPSA
jgi:hypothetical protein